MRHHAFENEPSRHDLVAWYRRARERSRSLFALIDEESYYKRPIPLRNPLVFYEGHFTAFAVNSLVKLTMRKPGIDERLETIFARGIDPEDEASVQSPTDLWPSREEVQAYNRAAEALIEENLENSEAGFMVVEHELMHQETLMYLLNALGLESGGKAPASKAAAPVPHSETIPAGIVTLGQQEGFFGWDNEFPSMAVHVDEFELDAHNVTNAQYREFMEATGASPPHFWAGSDWRGTFGLQPLNEHAPVYVTHDEAVRYARWKGKRLPTEAEWQRAAEGTPLDGNFDFRSYEPVTAGQSSPSRFGIYDLIGNGWEWTSSVFEPFPGFKPMASYDLYSTDFFDGAHYVLKGASPVTARELVRPSFRNWFRPNYPYVFATFRCASSARR